MKYDSYDEYDEDEYEYYHYQMEMELELQQRELELQQQKLELQQRELKLAQQKLVRQNPIKQSFQESSLQGLQEKETPAEKKKVYSDKYFVIQNRLLNAITDLNLNERRLIMLLSPIVRQKIEENPKTREFYLGVKDFVAHYNIKSKNYYEELAKVADSILKKAFFYWDWKNDYKIKTGVSWVSSCKYLEHEGKLKIRLDDDVIEMLTIFDRHNPFTKLELQAITNLGCYGIILYLLISSCLNKQNKEAEYTIEFLREQFNCVEKYPLFTDFKRFVIQPAIKEIELNTTLRISFETIKQGKKTAKLKFFFREETDKISKPKTKKTKEIQERDKNTIDMLDNLTDKERAIAERVERELLLRVPDATPLHIQNTVKKALNAQKEHEERKNQDKKRKQKDEQIKQEQIGLYEQQWQNECLPRSAEFCQINKGVLRGCINPAMFDTLFRKNDYSVIMSMAKEYFCDPKTHDKFIIPSTEEVAPELLQPALF